jgi:hypothetical protein
MPRLLLVFVFVLQGVFCSDLCDVQDSQNDCQFHRAYYGNEVISSTGVIVATVYTMLCTNDNETRLCGYTLSIDDENMGIIDCEVGSKLVKDPNDYSHEELLTEMEKSLYNYTPMVIRYCVYVERMCDRFINGDCKATTGICGIYLKREDSIEELPYDETMKDLLRQVGSPTVPGTEFVPLVETRRQKIAFILDQDDHTF